MKFLHEKTKNKKPLWIHTLKINHNKILNSVVLRKLKYNGKPNAIKTSDRIIEITVVKAQEMV